MIAFHGKQEVKDEYLARVRAHRAADELIQGSGWVDVGDGVFKGCAVGCTLEAYDHARYPIELGIPERLAFLEDQLFECMSPEDAMGWPAAFLGAVPVGADLEGVWPRWAVWMLTDPQHGVIRHAGDRQDVRVAIERVASLYAQGMPSDQAAARAAARAARAAARAAEEAEAAARAAEEAEAAAAEARAAWAAARAAWAAAEAAWAAAWAAEAAAWAAARAAEEAEAASNEWAAAGAQKLLELLRAAPVVK